MYISPSWKVSEKTRNEQSSVLSAVWTRTKFQSCLQLLCGHGLLVGPFLLEKWVNDTDNFCKDIWYLFTKTGIGKVNIIINTYREIPCGHCCPIRSLISLSKDSFLSSFLSFQLSIFSTFTVHYNWVFLGILFSWTWEIRILKLGLAMKIYCISQKTPNL